MFNKKFPIIFIQKEKLTVSLVSGGKNPQLIKSDETGWNSKSLKDTLTQAKDQLKTNTVRLLLDDNLSSTLGLTIPLKTSQKHERKVIAEKIKLSNPEILENNDWDFKETGKKDQSSKEIIAFVPDKEKFAIILKAFSEANLEIEAVEPEVVAKLRHENPTIGLALKKDLQGKDENTLNIIPQISTKEPKPSLTKTSNDVKKLKPSQKDFSIKPDKAPANKKLIIIFLITFVLGALIAGGIITSRKALNKPKPSPTPLVVASPDPSPSNLPPSATPEPDIVLTDYKVLVLNGTGGKGVAGAVKDILENEGFKDIEADNADEFESIETSIQLKESIPEKLFEEIDRALNSDYDVIKSTTPLTDDDDYDVIITVGEIKS